MNDHPLGPPAYVPDADLPGARVVADLRAHVERLLRELADAKRVAQYETAVAESEIGGRKHAERQVAECEGRMTDDHIAAQMASFDREVCGFGLAVTSEQMWRGYRAICKRLLKATPDICCCPTCGGPVRHTCEDCGETFYDHGSSMRLSTRRFAPALREARELLREARAHVHTLDAAWVRPWCERVAVALGETAGAR